jgi:inorganic triphosphatase YgiF
MMDVLETEIKLLATPDMLEHLRSHPMLAGAEQTGIRVTAYYDSIDSRLRRGGAALRIRKSAKDREQTLKLNSPFGSPVQRQEWNVAIAGDQPEPSGFPVKAREVLFRLLDGAVPERFATSHIERTSRRLHIAGSAIEVSFDLGTIEAGNRVEAVCELEIELVDGQLGGIMGLALHLPLGPELNWSITSKAERCYLLAHDLLPAACEAQPVTVSPDMPVASAFQAIAWNCLGHLLANYPLVTASGDPEAVHQSRVAIRRLRAACGLFGNVAVDEDAPVLRAELKAAAKGLGAARDLHVLLGHAISAAKASNRDHGELLAHLCAQRDQATHSAQLLLAGGPFQRLLFQYGQWIDGGEWLARITETGVDQPLAPFAVRALSKRRRKLRHLVGPLADMSDAARHRLRIEAKKLRYAAEFFAPLYAGHDTARHRRPFVKALTRLQDSLGELNDRNIAAKGRNALFADLEPITAARLATQLEELLADQGKSRHKLLKVADRSLAKVTGAPAWWKDG